MNFFTKTISILLVISTILLVNAIVNFILVYHIADTQKYSHIVIPFEFVSGKKYHKQFHIEKDGEYSIKLRFYKCLQDDKKDKSIGIFLIKFPSNYSSWPFNIILFEDNSVILNSDSLSSPGYNNTKVWREKYIGLFDGRTGPGYSLNMEINAPISELEKTRCEIVIEVSSCELVDKIWQNFADKMISAVILLYLLGIFHILYIFRLLLGYKNWIFKMISRLFV